MIEVFETPKPGRLLGVIEVIFDPHFQRRRTIVMLGEAVVADGQAVTVATYHCGPRDRVTRSRVLHDRMSWLSRIGPAGPRA